MTTTQIQEKLRQAKKMLHQCWEEQSLYVTYSLNWCVYERSIRILAKEVSGYLMLLR